jgi:CheY-like chemotaxis protein
MADPKRILLVEDNKRDVELTLDALENHHLSNQIVVARDGAEALDYLYRRGQYVGNTGDLPGLIMLDLKMPRVDGLEVLRQIKGDPTLRRIPVVMMTSSREQSDVIRSYDLGVNAYVVKPVKFQEFMDSVKQLGLFWVLVNESPPQNAASSLVGAPKTE